MPKRQPDRKLERLWRRRLAHWRRSGLSVRAYCAAHGLTEPNFYAWRRELRRRDARRAAGPPPAAFVPISVLPPPIPVPLELVLPDGRVLRIPAGFDADTLRRVLATCESPSEGPPC